MRQRESKKRFTRAFTLIEILVVLVIVGVTVGAIAIAMGSSGVREVENSAQRAQRLVQLACERALYSGRDIGFTVVEDGLRFGYFELEGWRPFGEDDGDELRARALGRDLVLKAERDGIGLVLTKNPAREPSFACLSSGELTPFFLQIERADSPATWEVRGDMSGQVALKEVTHAR